MNSISAIATHFIPNFNFLSNWENLERLLLFKNFSSSFLSNKYENFMLILSVYNERL